MDGGRAPPLNLLKSALEHNNAEISKPMKEYRGDAYR